MKFIEDSTTRYLLAAIIANLSMLATIISAFTDNYNEATTFALIAIYFRLTASAVREMEKQRIKPER